MLDAFAALSQPTRLETFRLLIKAGETGMPAGSISETLGVRSNTMSANLAVLSRSGLIRKKRQGRTIRYFADSAGIAALMAFLLQDCCDVSPELCQPVLEHLTQRS